MINFLTNGAELKNVQEEKKIRYNNWKVRIFSDCNYTFLFIILKYTISEVEEKQVLLRGKKQVIPDDQVFDVLHRPHVERTGHGGRNAMDKDLECYHGIGQ